MSVLILSKIFTQLTGHKGKHLNLAETKQKAVFNKIRFLFCLRLKFSFVFQTFGNFPRHHRSMHMRGGGRGPRGGYRGGGGSGRGGSYYNNRGYGAYNPGRGSRGTNYNNHTS